MRKSLFTLLFLVITLLLVGCQGDPEPKDIVVVANQTLTDVSLQADVVINDATSLAELNEIAFNVASQIYEDNFLEIGSKKMTFTLRFYASEEDFQANEVTYGTLTFDINLSVSAPGLSLKTNALTFE
ncbi:MAG: hypothetical protein C4537_01445 [Acholeplasma sp.]|jgi:PBP1b-binding outer membrane lipoprotein LpoB|nr:MAG: hypothetical protein C4537_01445 [Acholeplasma sp.]